MRALINGRDVHGAAKALAIATAVSWVLIAAILCLVFILLSLAVTVVTSPLILLASWFSRVRRL